MTATASAGLTSGRVILVNRCQAVAPSTVADSYRSAEMPCNPARISNAMNGVVFQVSAMMTANRAGHCEEVHRMWVPSTLFRMPCGSKMTIHSLEVTAVGMAHGTRMAARIRPRPLNALFMTSAKHMPITVSNSHRDDGEEDR